VAIPLHECALAGRGDSPGENHPTMLNVLYEFCLLHQTQRHISEARRLAVKLVSGACLV
jgi:hypothetical protein